MKIATLWGRSDTFDKQGCHFGEGNFSGGVMKEFLALRCDFSTTPRVPGKVWGIGSKSTLGLDNKATLKERSFFKRGKKGDARGKKLEDDPAGHDFVFRDLITINFYT